MGLLAGEGGSTSCHVPRAFSFYVLGVRAGTDVCLVANC